MVVAYVVNAVARQKIKDASSICSEQFGSQATLIPHVHLQQIEQPHPLRVHMSCVSFRPGARGLLDLIDRSHIYFDADYGETAIEVVAFPTEYVATCVRVPLLVFKLNDSIEG